MDFATLYAEDIETEPNPIAKRFDMKDLAPRG